MQFLRVAIFAVASAAYVSASAIYTRTNGGACSAGGKTQCCENLISDGATKKAFSALAGFDGLEGLLGFGCIDVPVAAGGVTNQCKSTPVCCSDVKNNGLFSAGCVPVTVN